MTTQQPILILCELADTGIEGIESYSPFCLKVHRALRAAGLRYERKLGQAPSDFKRWNSTGQVPVLLIDGAPLADSTAIVRRVDELASGVFTQSLDPRQRAEAWLWEELADTALSGFVVAARWADERNWERVRQTFFGATPWFVQHLIAPQLRKRVLVRLAARDVWRRGAEACWERFGTTLDELDARSPERDFWMGDALSVADLGLFGQLQSFRTPLTPCQREQVEARKRLNAYLDRVDAATRRVAYVAGRADL